MCNEATLLYQRTGRVFWEATHMINPVPIRSSRRPWQMARRAIEETGHRRFAYDRVGVPPDHGGTCRLKAPERYCWAIRRTASCATSCSTTAPTRSNVLSDHARLNFARWRSGGAVRIRILSSLHCTPQFIGPSGGSLVLGATPASFSVPIHTSSDCRIVTVEPEAEATSVRGRAIRRRGGGEASVIEILEEVLKVQGGSQVPRVSTLRAAREDLCRVAQA